MSPEKIAAMNADNEIVNDATAFVNRFRERFIAAGIPKAYLSEWIRVLNERADLAEKHVAEFKTVRIGIDVSLALLWDGLQEEKISEEEFIKGAIGWRSTVCIDPVATH